MKKIIFLVAVAIIGGVCIWSCSQDDELENGGALYRYTDKELAEIRSLAEKYGLVDVEYPIVSETPLMSVDEMEETFKVFAAIGENLAQPMDIVDNGDDNNILYRMPSRIFPLRRMSGGESYTGSQSENGFVKIKERSCYWEITVSWTKTNDV